MSETAATTRTLAPVLSGLGLLSVLLLAAGLRLHGLADAPLWTDELFSLQSSWGRGFFVETLPRETVLDPAPDPTALAAAGPIFDIYATQQTDTHPPLYFMVLRVFRSVAGDCVWAIRLPSVLASLAAVVAVYLAVAVAAGRAAGLAAALLVALATPQVVFAQEARGYMMASACVLGAAAAVLRVERLGVSTPRLATFVLLSVAAVGTLYIAALPLLGLGAYALLHLRGGRRWAVLLAGLAAAAVAAALLWPLLREQLQHVGHRNAWLTAEVPRTLPEVAAELAQAAVLGAVAPAPPRAAAASMVAGAVAALLMAAAYRRGPATRPWTWMVLTATLPLAAWDLLGDRTHLQQPRYLFLAGGPFLAWLACLPAALGRLAWTVPLLASVFAAVSLPEAYRSTKEEWNLVRDYAVAGHARPTDLYIVAAHGGRDWEHILFLGLSRYLRDAWGRETRLAIALHTDAAADRTLLRRDAEQRGGVVTFSEPGTAVDGLVPPEWRRTALLNVPSVGILQTFRPAD